MRNFPRVISLLFCFLFTCVLAAQSAYDVVVERFVNEHNASVSMRNWAKVEYAPVTLRVNDDNELEAFIDNDQQLRLTLQREDVSEMDGIFPRVIDSAIIIITNETAIIIDPVERMHFALSLSAEPKLPAISADPTLVFEGYGLGRHWSKM